MKATNTDATQNGNLSTQPFTFTTSAAYELDRDALQQQTDKAVQRTRAWWFPKIKILSCSKGTVQMLVTNDQKQQQTLTMLVSADALTVHCDCGQPVPTVCPHVYHALFSYTSYTAPFEQYKAGGLYEMAMLHPASFEKTQWGRLQYKPKDFLKTVYSLDQYRPCDLPEIVFTQPGIATEETAVQKALCFILIESYRTRDFHAYKRLPAISPCMGTTTLAGRDIKGFDDLLSGAQKQVAHLLTPNQQELNRLGLAMWKLVEQVPGRFCRMTDEQQALAAQLFSLWEAALPLLCQERFTFAYGVHFWRHLKEKPRKSRLSSFSTSPHRPRLLFVLEDYGIYYKLKAAVAIQGKQIPGFELANPFFIRVQDEYFLLASLRDVLVLEWMEKLKQQVTVFKEHAVAFEQEILQPLRGCYDIIFTQGKKQKR